MARRCAKKSAGKCGLQWRGNSCDYGWQYIVVDIQWYEPHAEGHDYRAGAALTMDQFGRLASGDESLPFCCERAGFKHLATYVHSKGLKFGIHIMRGIPRQAVEQNLPILGTQLSRC